MPAHTQRGDNERTNVKDVYNEFPDVPGESQRYKFTKVVQQLYQFATVAQAAEAGTSQIQHEAQEIENRKWTQELESEFWNQTHLEVEIIGEHCPRDQNHILKVTRAESKYLEQQFQEHLKELKGSSGDYICELYTSTTVEPAKAKAPPPGAPARAPVKIVIASRAETAQLQDAINRLNSSSSTQTS